MMADDVRMLVAAVEKELPEERAVWPGGWPDQIEAALIDAVRSIRAEYGRAHNGVRGAVGQWRTHRGTDRPDDLTVLAATDPESMGQKLAYTDVVGLGDVTWEYFLMLLGKPGVKADVWIVRFVSKAVGRTTSSPETRDLVKAAAAELGTDPTALDHAIWSHQRGRSGLTGA